jgi:Fe-S cluster biogenesis protein NfuA
MSVSRRSASRRTELEARIRAALDSLRPLLHIETRVLEVVEFRPDAGELMLRVEGECRDCDMTAAQLMDGIEAHLRNRVPEIRVVRVAGLSNGTDGQ